MNQSTTSRYKLSVAAMTDIGRTRTSNQDAFVVAPLAAEALPISENRAAAVLEVEPRPVLLAVSDGMGGAAAGEVASALVVESLRRSLPAESASWDLSIQSAVARANEEVWKAAQTPKHHGMGATLTAVCVHGNEAHVAEVGDSRAYIVRGGQIRQITRDQSYVQMLLDAGAVSPDEAAHSPMKNVILSAMGIKPEVRVEMGHFALDAGDTILVCCDGLTNEVADHDIARVLATSPSPADACTMLVQLANEHGGHDNITVIVARLDDA
ncbi:MAG TPA: PP2C family serine/threonine-protein phosphatase, partial [Polyangiaceae bacterium]